MNQYKICMLGAFHSGKTSLVDRYVNGWFNENIKATLGVRIDKKEVQTQTGSIELVIWDMVGANKYQQVQTTYLRNASAYILVVDGTRVETARAAIDVHKKAQKVSGSLPFILIVNKSDLVDEWAHESPAWAGLSKNAIATVRTSAKSGVGVDQAFELLAERFQVDLLPA
ncbi:MAG: Rab family GTPase [Burkholderiaceae bacterium]